MKLFKLLPAFLLVFFACTQQSEQNQMDDADMATDTENAMHTESEISKAVATVSSLTDEDISGTVTFEQAEGGVLVKGSFYGLSAGEHGFHIHEYGDCTAEDGTSAGGHFNPTNNDHGAPTQDNRHMGDMGNLVAEAGEVATIEYVDPKIDIDDILGRGIIIHAGEDDLESQPSGAAGNRIACGVIGVASQK